MEFYKDKLVFHRKKEPFSSGRLAEKLGVSRTTYWKWEKGLATPNTKQVREIAEILKISVSDISDLSPLPNNASARNSSGLSENIDSWLSFFDLNENENFHRKITNSLNASLMLSDKLKEAGIIIEALLAGINSIFYIKNTELKYMTSNDAFLKNLSLKPDFTVFGKNDEDFFNIKEAKENTHKDEQVLITKKQTTEEGFIPGSKKKKWGIITRTPVFDLHGNISGLITNMVDITDRKRAEYKSELLSKCIESIPESVTIYNYTQEKTVYANTSASEISGYSLEEIYNPTNNLELNTIYSEEEKKKVLEYRKNASWPKSRYLQIISKDGSLKWIHFSHSSLTSFMENQYLVSIARDMTKDRAVSKQFSAFRSLFDCAQIGTLLRNMSSGKALFVNKYYASIFGYPTNKFINDNKFRINNCVHIEDKKQEEKYFESNEYPNIRDYRIRRPDGEIRDIREIAFKTEIENEIYTGYMCRDVTEQKKIDTVDLNKIVKTLKKRNISYDIISEATGLDKEKIKVI